MFKTHPRKTYPLKTWAAFLAVFALVQLGTVSTASAAQNDKLQIKVLEQGSGTKAQPKDRVQVHYTGWLMDGTKFDSSRDRDQPLTFTLGAGQVIAGWDEGVKGMLVGGKRELIIPAAMGYGATGYPPVIPPNATLKFEVELVAIAGPSYANIDNDKLKDLMARGVPVIDIRRAEEWKQTGVIKGAVKLTAFDGQGRINPAFLPGLSKIAGKDDEVILICRTGNRTSTISAALADQVGYSKIYNVEKGMVDWIKAGEPVVKN